LLLLLYRLRLRLRMLHNLMLPSRPSLKLRRLKGSVWRLRKKRKGKLIKLRRRELLKLQGGWR
jgi:hypothetical protein